MEIKGYPVRNEKLVWQNIADQVVIADINNDSVRILNEVAGLVWSLADGTREIEVFVSKVCETFEVEPEEARLDVKEFLQELVEAGLIRLNN